MLAGDTVMISEGYTPLAQGYAPMTHGFGGGGLNGAGARGGSQLLEAEVIATAPLVLKILGAGGGAGDGASATAEGHASRLAARGAAVQVDKLGNRIAYKRQLQAFFTDPS